MKTNEASKKGMYIGSGIGLGLFAIIGLLPGSFIGGVVGLNIAGKIFGLPLETTIMPRLIVAVSMVAGVLISAMVFTVGASLAGWMVGHAIDMIRHGHKTPAEATVKTK